MLGILMLHVNANTIFVKQGGTGDGSSWANATGDLTAALFVAKSGDEVWVAQGTYLPTNQKDRKATFTIPAGVRVYGGFSGQEATLAQRNFKAYKTVLSGNIGAKDDFMDNSFSVVTIGRADASTQLNGFIIADGTADGTGPTGDKERCGAGLYLDGAGSGNHSNPTIENCIFQNNYARDGGAAYLNGKGGQCNPTFNNCEFLSNRVDLDGGALFNDGRHGGEASPAFTNCIFNGNEGNYGGAICNYGGKGVSSPKLQNCVFRNNEAYLRGGAIFNMDVEGKTQPVINACQFVDNLATMGEGMYTFSNPEGGIRPVKTSYKMN
jgi:hypothetical protein